MKALNTVTAHLMINPRRLSGGEHTTFVCGNDVAAKETAVGLLQSLGWSDVLDLGDITAARAAEMYLPLWLRLWQALGTPILNIKVVR